MNAGKLDRRIEIQTYTTTTDDWNHPTKSWTTTYTVWASKVDKSESERTELDQTVAVNRTIWTIRYIAGLDATARVKYGDDIYEVRGVKELGRREGIQLTTERRQ